MDGYVWMKGLGVTLHYHSGSEDETNERTHTRGRRDGRMNERINTSATRIPGRKPQGNQKENPLVEKKKLDLKSI